MRVDERVARIWEVRWREGSGSCCLCLVGRAGGEDVVACRRGGEGAEVGGGGFAGGGDGGEDIGKKGRAPIMEIEEDELRAL